MSVVAVLPIKRFDAAKQRLEPALPANARRELAASMAADVLEALGRAGGLDAVVVVSGEGVVLDMAAGAGFEPLRDDRDDGQSAAAVLGLAHPRARDAQSALLVPGDCPALDPADVERLLAGAAPPPSVAVVPDRHGTGTNALLLTPPGVMGPAFGPGSFNRHVEAAKAAGAVVHVERLASLALDVDTAADLDALRAALESVPGAAPRTRAVLTRLATSAA
jgi:2-phospho-L-lactate/phosphoenolpyruvate guanylyltransferase